MKATSYRRIAPGEPMYELVEANKRAGRWVCDAFDHNEAGGCSNPQCFKFTPPSVRRRFRVRSAT